MYFPFITKTELMNAEEAFLAVRKISSLYKLF